MNSFQKNLFAFAVVANLPNLSAMADAGITSAWASLHNNNTKEVAESLIASSEYNTAGNLGDIVNTLKQKLNTTSLVQCQDIGDQKPERTQLVLTFFNAETQICEMTGSNAQIAHNIEFAVKHAVPGNMLPT